MISTRQMIRRLTMTCAVPALLTAPAAADPTIGVGLSLSFGSGTVEPGIGVRVFSDDEEDSAVASIGLDYVFPTKSIRGTIGAAYLFSDWYIGGDLGVDFSDGSFSPGFGLGWAETDDDDFLFLQDDDSGCGGSVDDSDLFTTPLTTGDDSGS